MDDYSKQSDDGMKELNTVTEEYYEEKRKEDCYDEEEDKPKKSIYDYVRIGLILISYVIFFFADIIDEGFALMAFAIFFFTIATFFLGAIKKFITEGDNCSLLFRASFFLRVILLLFFFVSLSMIFLTKNVYLNYTYWIAIFSFLTIASMEVIESMIEDYRNRKNHSLFSRICRGLFNIFLLIIWINLIAMVIRMSLPVNGSTIVVNQLKMPDRIEIIKICNNSSYVGEALSDNMITITDQSFHQQLKTELENKNYEPMNIISELNFIKLIHTTPVYYQLDLYYNKYDRDNVFAYPFSLITFIDNKIVFRYNNIRTENSLLKTTLNDYYYLELSEETRNTLYSYIDKLE